MELCAISTPLAISARELKESYKCDFKVQEILKKMQNKTINSFKYAMHDGIYTISGKKLFEQEISPQESIAAIGA